MHLVVDISPHGGNTKGVRRLVPRRQGCSRLLTAPPRSWPPLRRSAAGRRPYFSLLHRREKRAGKKHILPTSGLPTLTYRYSLKGIKRTDHFVTKFPLFALKNCRQRMRDEAASPVPGPRPAPARPPPGPRPAGGGRSRRGVHVFSGKKFGPSWER